MIARIFIQIILMIVLPDLYLDWHYLRHRLKMNWWKRLLWWIPCLMMIAFSIGLATQKNFVPEDQTWINTYLVLLGLVVVPKALFSLMSFLGLLYCRFRHSKLNFGNLLGVFFAILSVFILIYGFTIGFCKLNVKHIDYYSNDLPSSFDGYRVVAFADIHAGTYNGWRRKVIEKTIDSINVQHADAVFFIGDIQNLQTQELYPFINLFSSIKSRDGVFSVLGNHDYSYYIAADEITKVANEREIASRERQFGWTLLKNESKSIHRGNDSIVIAGEENDGEPPFPSKGDIKKTLKGVSNNAFVVMLQHDPTAWRRDILPHSNVQLTLSGHTHGGQFKFLGWSPVRMFTREWYGMFTQNGRTLYVTAGVGALIPFRFGISNEIAVITFHKTK